MVSAPFSCSYRVYRVNQSTYLHPLLMLYPPCKVANFIPIITGQIQAVSDIFRPVISYIRSLLLPTLPDHSVFYFLPTTDH